MLASTPIRSSHERRGIELVILEIMGERSRLRDVLGCTLELRCHAPNAPYVGAIVPALVGAEKRFDNMAQVDDVLLSNLGHDGCFPCCQT